MTGIQQQNRASVAITGATGSLGADVVKLLAADNLPLRLIVRNASRAPDVPNTEIREAGYQDTDAFAQAVEGFDTVFLVSLPESEQRRVFHRCAVEACRKAGVGRIVYTSFLNAVSDAAFTLVRDHHDTEAALQDSGIPYVALRDSFYTEMLPLMVSYVAIANGEMAVVSDTVQRYTGRPAVTPQAYLKQLLKK